MHLSKYALLIGLLLVIFFVGLLGQHFGFTVNGVPYGGQEGNGVDWVAGAAFLFNMVVFRVDGVPGWLNTIFVIMSLMVVFIIINLVRGTD